MRTCRGVSVRLASIVFLAAVFTVAPSHTAWAQTAPPMGTAQSYGVLAGTEITNTGATTITGDLGLHPGTSITGAPLVSGVTNTATVGNPAAALQAKNDLVIAYNNLAGQACFNSYTGPAELAGSTLVGGVYCVDTSFGVTGTLILDGQNNPNTVWVFQMGSTLGSAVDSSVSLINGAQACNVFWQVGSSATIGVRSAFVGNILALTNIALNTQATLAGRALARNAAVNMDTNSITATTCATAVPPTLLKTFTPDNIQVGSQSLLTITLSNPNGSAVTGASLTDTLPPGLTFVAAGNAVNNGCGGTLTNTLGVLTLTGASIPANGSCTITALVESSGAGSYENCITNFATTSPTFNVAQACDTLDVTETPLGTLQVIKTSFGGFGTFTFTTSLGNCTITTTAPSTPASGTCVFTNVPGGTVVTVTENSQANWAVTSNACASVTVAAGPAVTTCNIQNTFTAPPIPPGTVRVIKNTVGGNGSFTFNGSGGLGSCTLSTTGNTGTCTFPNAVPPGTYNITEAGPLPAGWTQTSGTCTVAVASSQQAICTFTNTFVPIPPTPGRLTLTKKANKTTYKAGDTIIYTYTLKNTGTVTLTGPFTVTDDKLGTFVCGIQTPLAPGASISCTKSYTVQASDLCSAPSTTFTQGVTANINTGAWLGFVNSAQDTKITGAGPSVPNGTYSCWCIQDYVPRDLHNELAKLYSTTGVGLPADVAGLAWKKINYVLNNKGGGSGLTRVKSVQTAIWRLLGETNPEFGLHYGTSDALVNAANANPNYVPGPNGITAVLIYSDGIFGGPRPNEVQESICEVKPKCDKVITNKATASGFVGNVTVTSAQVTLTIKAG